MQKHIDFLNKQPAFIAQAVKYIIMAKVKYISLSGYKRVMIASDLHGNVHLLRRLLDKVGFAQGDALVLLGDYIEKGCDSLGTVRHIKKLCEKGNVFCLQGNCDTLWNDLQARRYKANIVQYMLWRKNSILCDMCRELDITVNADTDPGFVFSALERSYKDIFIWLNDLPQIMESEDYVFAHAGLDRTTDLEGLDPERCLVRSAFYEENLSFDKYVVVGHMVLNNYCEYTKNILSFIPIVDSSRHIIMVDGGSGVKDSGQQNLLIIDGLGSHCEYEDDLPKLVAIDKQVASTNPMSIIWNHNRVKILERGNEQSICFHIYSGREAIIPNKLLFEKDNEWASYDYTDYQIGIEAGDVVSLVEEYNGRYMVKNNGVLGWAKKQLFTPR